MSSLMLYPVNAAWAPQRVEDFESRLHTIGLTGNALPEKCGPGFLVGEKFLSLVAFMGCAPAINLQPDVDNPDPEYCAVRIKPIHESPDFLIASRHSLPRCPLCRAVVAVDTNKLLAEALVTCERCTEQTSVYALNWRRGAGYARCFVEITGVYPQEALPTEALLNALQEISKCEWRYFYY